MAVADVWLAAVLLTIACLCVEVVHLIATRTVERSIPAFFTEAQTAVWIAATVPAVLVVAQIDDA